MDRKGNDAARARAAMETVGTKKALVFSDGAGSVCATAAVFALLYLACFATGIVAEYPLPVFVFGVFVIHLFYLFSYKVFFFKYIWLIVMLAWLVIADALLVTNPIWLNELQLATFENGSLLPIASCASIVLQFLLFLEVLSGKLAPLENEDGEVFSKERITLVKTAGIIALVVAVGAFLCVAPNPSWAVSRDRFDYATNYLPSFLRSFQSLLILVIPMAAPCLKVDAKKIFYSVVVFYALYLIWTGEKFTSLFLLFYILVLIIGIPKLRRIDPAKMRSLFRRMIAVFCIVVACFFVLVFSQYVRQFGSVDAAIGTVEQRIAAQAEIWWGTYGEAQGSNELRMEEIEDELDSISISAASNETRIKGGMWKLMRVVMPPGYYHMYVENSTRLTSSTPATFYYYLGYPGMLFGMLLLGCAYFFAINAAVAAFGRGRILEGVLSVYLIRIMHGVILMSDFGDLFYWRSLVVIVLLVFLAVIRALSRRRAYALNPHLLAGDSGSCMDSHGVGSGCLHGTGHSERVATEGMS